MLRYDFYNGWYLPSKGTIANVVLRCFDVICQGQIFRMQISLKWLAKHASYGFYIFWYLLLNGAIPKVVLCGVSLLFQGKIFHISIYRKQCELRKYVKNDFYRRWYLPSISNHCENHTLRPWLAISWSKLQILTKLFQQIFLRLHGTCRRIALVILVRTLVGEPPCQ